MKKLIMLLLPFVFISASVFPATNVAPPKPTSRVVAEQDREPLLIKHITRTTPERASRTRRLTVSSHPATLPKRTVTQSNDKILTSDSVWDRLAMCESSGNWAANTGNGFYGGVQFDLPSWHSAGGVGYPHEASRSEQIKRAKIWLAKTGWYSWPACSRKLGLR